MFDKGKDIIIEEMNVKPNKYSAKAMSFVIAAAVIVLILNEIGIFKSKIVETRISIIVALCFLIAPIILVTNKKLVRMPQTKYIVIICSIISTLFVTTFLFFHATIIILFPLFLAMQYKSKRIGWIALIGSLIIAFVAPVLGYALKLWDTDFLRYLVEICGGDTSNFVPTFQKMDITLIFRLVLYLGVPKVLTIFAFGIFMFNVISNGIESVNNQIKLKMFNQIDTLTGLYNRNFYKDLVSEKYDDKNVGIIFFDVNCLKLTNDTKGHEYGDMLLKKCAESILRITSDKVIGIRYGGDEFLVIADVETKEELDDVISLWTEAINEINGENADFECSMAFGISFGKFNQITELIREADMMMYEEKGRK